MALWEKEKKTCLEKPVEEVPTMIAAMLFIERSGFKNAYFIKSVYLLVLLTFLTVSLAICF